MFQKPLHFVSPTRDRGGKLTKSFFQRAVKSNICRQLLSNA